jgi:hypothetical protein
MGIEERIQSTQTFADYMPTIHEQIEGDEMAKYAFHYGFAEGYNTLYHMGIHTSGVTALKRAVDTEPTDPLAMQYKEIRPVEFALGISHGVYAKKEELIR